MAAQRSVVFNGDLGSGKTTVSKLLAQRLGMRRISVGDLYRDMAAQRGLSALQINLHAELDDKIDHYVDQLQRDIAASGEHLIVDSRLAWHFFTGAFKVHLITDPAVAARRVLGRPADTVESYASVEEARIRLASRSESERIRFLTRYGVDKTHLHNYDLICDTTRATPEQIVERIVDALAEPAAGTECHIDPRRIRSSHNGQNPAGPIVVAYALQQFWAVEGTSRLRSAQEDGTRLIRAMLIRAS
jgi:CMP/dCMP kinase